MGFFPLISAISASLNMVCRMKQSGYGAIAGMSMKQALWRNLETTLPAESMGRFWEKSVPIISTGVKYAGFSAGHAISRTRGLSAQRPSSPKTTSDLNILQESKE
jgi:hypothetical protein